MNIIDSEEFNNWNKLKIKINNSEKEMSFKEREIWWINLGKNVGYEQDGKNYSFTRLVLILKRFNREMFLGIPISSKIKTTKYHYIFKRDNKEYSAIISQMRLFSSKRLLQNKGKIQDKYFNEIKERIKQVIL